jgi:mycothiol S-conjugate amidase
MTTLSQPPNLSDLAAYAIESLWLNSAPAARTLLVVYAHPDDESFGNAGTIAHYTAAGVAVHYACATRGECGTVEPSLLDGYEDTAALRTAELACAARTLNLAAVHFLGYRDSGMPGSPDNQHPASLVQAPQERVIGQVVALIRALRPQVVLTFGPYGGYGHPDHIAIHQATLAAFGAAGSPARYPDQLAAGLAPYAPAKLYYSTFGGRLIKAGVALMRLFGQDPRRSGENGDVDLARAAAEVTPITTSIDSSAYMPQKLRAWECHRSQLGGMRQVQRMPAPLRRMFVGAEHFTRVAPPWPARRARERDLFDGI